MPHSRGISNPRYSGYSFLLDLISLTGLSPCFAQLSRRFSYRMQYLIRVHNTTSPNDYSSGFSLTYASFTRRYIKASQLISFPAPTWMFPSGAFPLLNRSYATYWFAYGVPIRLSRDLSVLAATPCISQLATAFIGAQAYPSPRWRLRIEPTMEI